jgi:2-keto-3-deoxy-L-rhamnonate aldolase RhmA
MATRATGTAALVRVPWNDPVLIKPVLDLGATGVIVPMVRTADDVRRAVAACLYPPEGIRGFGPRRPSQYGRLGGPDFCREANSKVLPVVQIEHIDAVENIDEILAVPGLASIAFGPNDLAGSMGLTGQPRHPNVLRAIDSVIARSRRANVPVGISVGEDPGPLVEWASWGVNWLAMGGDLSLMLRAATEVAGRVREQVATFSGEAP